MNKQQVDEKRKFIGTLPDQHPEKSYEYFSVFDEKACNVNLADAPVNPYKHLITVTSTWADSELGYGHGATGKWQKLTPEGRYIACLGVLTGKAIPTPMEGINLLWEINGVPRHTFDQFARARVGAGYVSIGCRDNSKLGAPLILYPELYDELQENKELKVQFESWLKQTKDLYESIVNMKRGSWQEARAVLPMSYNHTWTCYMTLAAFKGQAARRLAACEEPSIVLLFWKMWNIINDKWPLIASTIRPFCDGAKKCLYAGNEDEITKYYSSLFACCGRHVQENISKYAEFNKSCTNTNELRKHVNYIDPDKYINYKEGDFNKLLEKDRTLFEAD